LILYIFLQLHIHHDIKKIENLHGGLLDCDANGLVGGYQCFRRTYWPEDGGSMFPLNVGTHLQVHTVLQPRGQPQKSSPIQEIQISYETENNRKRRKIE
jgi:hypothetical protein